MCQLCAEFRPWDVTCPYKTPESHPVDEGESGALDSSLPVYSYDQIADQLTNGYWGGASYAFNLGGDRTLTVDLAGLTQAGQEMARLALDAWSVATGITFQEEVTSAATTTRQKTGDAGGGTANGYALAVGQDFKGSLSSAGDRDSVAIFLEAGDRITITVTPDGSGGSAASDLSLRLLASSGAVLQVADDPYGVDVRIAYEVTSTGTYYVETGAAAGASPGDYRLSIRDVRATSDIRFDDTYSGAFAQFWAQGSTIIGANVNIDANWAGGQSRIDGYFFQTYLHEIGHALGLGHAGNYNGSASYPSDADYLNNSWQASVMSYFYQTENSFVDASFAYAITPQVADLIAIQSLYGTAGTRMGDDVYGANGTTGSYLDAVDDLSNPVSYTIYDGGGTDTFDFRDQNDDQRLDMREEQYSDIGGLVGNVGIGRGTVIENAFTGGGDDIITGNDTGNGLSAGAGDDILSGRGGNDAIAGDAGADQAGGDAGRDLIAGGTGDDFIDGDAGGDLLFGDDVTLADLTGLFPDWTPPADASDLLAEGDLLALWDDILEDVFAIA